MKKSDYQWFINSNSNCPSPTGEARWGLMSFSQSNLFLPLGKVRMGCPWGRSGWVILRGMLGWVRDRVGADAIRLVLIFCHYTCGLSWFIARYVCEVVTHPLLSIPFFVPFLGKHVAQVGQARYPTWASTLPHLGTFPSPPVPNIPLFHHTNLFLCFYCKG